LCSIAQGVVPSNIETKKQDSIIVRPSAINISVIGFPNMKLPQTNLQVTSKENINEIQVHPSDLQPHSPGKFWIPRHLVNVTPNKFGINASRIIDLDVSFNFTNISGTYTGNLTLASVNGIKVVPIEININENFPLFIFGILSLGIGIGLAFTVKMIRVSNTGRLDALDSLIECKNEMYKARLERRIDPQFDSGVNDLFSGMELLGKGFFSDAKNDFDSSKEAFKSAKKDDGSIKWSPETVLNDELPTEDKLIISAHAISGRGLRNSLKPDSGLIYFVGGVILFVAILQVWSTVLPKLLPLLDSPFWYITTAFLLGYGSQAVVNEVVDFFRRS
jgi:hypothetical protein